MPQELKEKGQDPELSSLRVSIEAFESGEHSRNFAQTILRELLTRFEQGPSSSLIELAEEFLGMCGRLGYQSAVEAKFVNEGKIDLSQSIQSLKAKVRDAQKVLSESKDVKEATQKAIG